MRLVASTAPYSKRSIARLCRQCRAIKYVRDLGIYIYIYIYVDSDKSMKTHVSRTVSSCFAAPRHICSIRRSVCQPVLLSLVTSLVRTRRDYGSVTLNGCKHLTPNAPVFRYPYPIRICGIVENDIRVYAQKFTDIRKYLSAVGHCNPQAVLWNMPVGNPVFFFSYACHEP